MSEQATAIGSQRALFEIPDDVTYLNCASMSPQLRTVTAAGFDDFPEWELDAVISGPGAPL